MVDSNWDSVTATVIHIPPEVRNEAGGNVEVSEPGRNVSLGGYFNIVEGNDGIETVVLEGVGCELNFEGMSVDFENYRYQRNANCQVRMRVIDQNGASVYSDPIVLSLPNNKPEFQGAEIEGENVRKVEGILNRNIFTPLVKLKGLFDDFDGDRLSYSWKLENAGEYSGFLETGVGEAQLVIRKAGTVKITVTVDDGYGGKISEVIYIFTPLPKGEVEPIITEVSDDNTIKGQLTSAVEPIVYVNGVMAEVYLADVSGDISKEIVRAGDLVDMGDIYQFTAKMYR